jgi:uncharacterized membrane protein YoaK (UPF0700 family)
MGVNTGIIEGDISDYIQAQWTIVAMMLLVIWLSIFFVKKYFFNDKIYGKTPNLKNEINTKEILSLLSSGFVVFMLVLISWNPYILYSIFGIVLLIFIIGGMLYAIHYIRSSIR